MKASELSLEDKIRGIVARVCFGRSDRERAGWVSKGTLTSFETSSWDVFEAARQAYNLGFSEGKKAKLPPATLAGPGGVASGSTGPARTPGDHKTQEAGS